MNEMKCFGDMSEFVDFVFKAVRLSTIKLRGSRPHDNVHISWTWFL
jgi:hypothetical protein